MYDPLVELVDTLPRVNIPDKTTMELECRFYIDERQESKQKRKRYSSTETIQLTKNIINHYLKKGNQCSIEQSINFINGQNIKQLVFINGKQQKDKKFHYIKNRIINPIIVHDDPLYRINVSFEKEIPEFNVKDCQFAKIKLRFSIIVDSWRLDITLVKNVKTLSNPKEIKSAKSRMLYEITTDTFIDKAPWSITDYIEIETEYISNMNNLSIQSITSAVNIIQYHISTVKNNKTIDNSNKHSNNYQTKIYEVAKYIQPKRANQFLHKWGIKQLSNQVIEMDKNTFVNNILNDITDYYITDKVDGKRTILYITPDGSWGISDTLEEFKSTNINNTFIFDTERYDTEGKDGIIHYIFDVMVWDGEIIINTPFSDRLEYFTRAVDLINGSVNGLSLAIKPFEKLTNDFQSQIKKRKKAKLPYETDGFIFTPYNGLYTSMVVYKYKPLDSLTVDFLIKKCPQKLLNIKPYIQNNNTLYLLFCGISKQVYQKLNMDVIKHYSDVFPTINYKHPPNYFPVQFQPSDTNYAYLFWSDNADLDNEIGEFKITNWKNNKPYKYKWELMRIREDRKVEVERGNYFGNNYKVAEFIWMSYQNPLIIEDEKLERYFQQHESKTHEASRSFNSYVKASILDQFKDVPYVMDLASGKGQDLFRYGKVRTKNLLCVERDLTALQELIKRKHDYSKLKDNGKMYIMSQQLDLTAPYKDNIAQLINSNIQLPNNGFDLIVCNFALHYLIGTYANVINIGKFINHYLKPGGRFIFTAFDGKKVLNLLEENKGEWKSSTPNKFHIKKKYTQTTIQPIGQKIDVLLPFSNDQYYTEYLVNIDYLSREYAKYGLTLETNMSFGDYQAKYKPRGDNKIMDADDLLYTSLYHYYGFYKTKKGGRKK